MMGGNHLRVILIPNTTEINLPVYLIFERVKGRGFKNPFFGCAPFSIIPVSAEFRLSALSYRRNTTINYWQVSS